jgi:hypothetical protein
MPTDITVMLEDRPGALAELGGALGKAGVNIEGICGTTVDDIGYVHVLVADAVKARRAIEANHIEVVDEKEVLLLEVEDRPGNLGNIARRLGQENISIEVAYLATSTRLVLVVDNIAKARQIFQTQIASIAA